MDTESAEEALCRECGGNHEGPCGLEKVISALSLSLSKGFEGTSRWSLSDTTAGLLKLYKRHTLEGAEDTIVGDPVCDRATLDEILEWLHWATAAYEKERAALLTSMHKQKLQYQDIVQMVTRSAINQPAYFIAVCHARQAVVMGIRGTYNATDILTDLNPHTEPFQHGAAHTGILGAANWLLEKEGRTLKNLLHDYPGYKLVLTGHSLGGAVAALLAMLLHASGPLARMPTKVAAKMDRFLPSAVAAKLERSFFPTVVGIPTSEIVCWGYGCAPCVDRALAEATAYIHNVVLQDDVVPRVNPAAIETLRDEIQETSLSQGLKDGKKKKVVESFEKVNVGKAFKSRYQKIQNARMEKKLEKHSPSSDSCSDAASLPGDGFMDSGDDTRGLESPGTESAIAAQAIATVAQGPAASKAELEERRLFVPGNLYHIRRRAKRAPAAEQPLGPPVPAKPFQEGVDAPRNSRHSHRVVRGASPGSRFQRIVLSRTMLSDHGCYNIRDALLDALEQVRDPLHRQQSP